MTNPLQQIIDAVGGVRQANRRETMSQVDVINRLVMNERQQHNMNRMDAQVDAHMRKQHGDCYVEPESLEMAEHRINSPTINIGSEAIQAMLAAAAQDEASSKPVATPQSQSSTPATSAAVIPASKSRVGDILKTAALVGATSLGTAVAVSYLTNDTDTDTRNTYQIEAVPFDPNIDPTQ